MRRHLAIGIATIVCGLGFPAHAANENLARKVAISAVTAMLTGDMEFALQFFSQDAESKSGGKGSAIAKFKRQPPEMFEKISLEEIIFFQSPGVNALEKRFSDDMWSRVGEKMEDGLGCLLVVSMQGRPEKGLLLWILKEQNGHVRIVYTDDN